MIKNKNKKNHYIIIIIVITYHRFLFPIIDRWGFRRAVLSAGARATIGSAVCGMMPFSQRVCPAAHVHKEYNNDIIIIIIIQWPVTAVGIDREWNNTLGTSRAISILLRVAGTCGQTVNE